MKNEKKLQVLCEQLPYGLKIFDDISKEILEALEMMHEPVPDEFISRYGRNQFEQASVDSELKPILHSMDYLTKEITIANYHDGKPFIPMEHLANEYGSFYLATIIDINMKIDSGCLTTYIADKLNKWHFNWRNLPESDYIRVDSLPKSPYA